MLGEGFELCPRQIQSRHMCLRVCLLGIVCPMGGCGLRALDFLCSWEVYKVASRDDVCACGRGGFRDEGVFVEICEGDA